MARILVCDDDVNYLEVLGAGLQELGHQVALTVRSSDVRDAIRSGDIDVAFLDLVMPKGGAVGLVHMIKSEFPHVKVVVATGRPFMFSSPVMEQGLGMADAKIRKGFTTEQLDDLIADLLANKE